MTLLRAIALVFQLATSDDAHGIAHAANATEGVCDAIMVCTPPDAISPDGACEAYIWGACSAPFDLSTCLDRTETYIGESEEPTAVLGCGVHDGVPYSVVLDLSYAEAL